MVGRGGVKRREQRRSEDSRGEKRSTHNALLRKGCVRDPVIASPTALHETHGQVSRLLGQAHGEGPRPQVLLQREADLLALTYAPPAEAPLRAVAGASSADMDLQDARSDGTGARVGGVDDGGGDGDGRLVGAASRTLGAQQSSSSGCSSQYSRECSACAAASSSTIMHSDPPSFTRTSVRPNDCPSLWEDAPMASASI